MRKHVNGNLFFSFSFFTRRSDFFFTGNAIYNISHPLTKLMLGQLEREAKQVYNTIPFDLRMGQVNMDVKSSSSYFSLEF